MKDWFARISAPAPFSWEKECPKHQTEDGFQHEMEDDLAPKRTRQPSLDVFGPYDNGAQVQEPDVSLLVQRSLLSSTDLLSSRRHGGARKEAK
jgi:hypothetical protein